MKTNKERGIGIGRYKNIVGMSIALSALGINAQAQVSMLQDAQTNGTFLLRIDGNWTSAGYTQNMRLRSTGFANASLYKELAHGKISRKHYAVKYLRRQLAEIYEDIIYSD